MSIIFNAILGLLTSLLCYYMWVQTEDLFFVIMGSGVIGFVLGYWCLAFELWGLKLKEES